MIQTNRLLTVTLRSNIVFLFQQIVTNMFLSFRPNKKTRKVLFSKCILIEMWYVFLALIRIFSLVVTHNKHLFYHHWLSRSKMTYLSKTKKKCHRSFPNAPKRRGNKELNKFQKHFKMFPNTVQKSST